MDVPFGPRSATAAPSRVGPPPRQLSPALRNWASRYGAVKVRWWLLAVIGRRCDSALRG